VIDGNFSSQRTPNLFLKDISANVDSEKYLPDNTPQPIAYRSL